MRMVGSEPLAGYTKSAFLLYRGSYSGPARGGTIITLHSLPSILAYKKVVIERDIVVNANAEHTDG